MKRAKRRPALPEIDADMMARFADRCRVASMTSQQMAESLIRLRDAFAAVDLRAFFAPERAP